MTAPPRSARILRRTLAILLGLALGLGALEGTLRAAGALVAPAADPLQPRAFEPEPPPGVEPRVVLCIGDSNTFGLHLAPRESYPAQLAAMLADAPGGPWRVLNYGVPGRNSAEARYHLVGQLARHRPEIVVMWGGVNTSWSRLMGHLWSMPDREEPPGARDTFENLRLVRMLRVLFDMPAAGAHTKVPLLDERISEHLFVTRPGQLPMEVLASGSGRTELMRRIGIDLTRIRALCDGAGAKLLVLDYPYDVPHIVNSVNPAIAEFAERTGTARLSLAAELQPRIERLGLELHTFRDYHLKAIATGEVARLVAERFAAEAWVERGPWLERATLEDLAHGLAFELLDADGVLTARITGPAGAAATLLVEPLAMRPIRDYPEPMPEPHRVRRALGALDAEGTLTVPLDLPPPPEVLTAPNAPPGVRFAGWRVRASLAVRRASVQTNAAFVGPHGRPIEVPTRAVLDALGSERTDRVSR